MTFLRQLPLLLLLFAAPADAALRAGAARVDITDREAGPVAEASYVKALAIEDGATRAVIVTVDAVAIGGIGRIDDGYLGRVRGAVERELGIPAKHILVNASHCHSVIRRDVDALTIEAVRQAWRALTPVRAGAGRGMEDRIQENRRMKLRDGRETDVRRAYAMPRDEDVVSTGPIDPEIGLLRLDRVDTGAPLAVVYLFAAHPIQGAPDNGNTADYPAFASRAIEENLGAGVLAFFVQGCAGDINPARYKNVHEPHDAEPLGNRLGLSALRGLRAIRTTEGATLRVVNETLALPRSSDTAARMAKLRARREELLKSLQGTTLNFKTFVTLYLEHQLSGGMPAYYAHGYLHEKDRGRQDLRTLDEENRAAIQAYLRNVETMEELTRLQTNLALIEQHHAEALKLPPTLEVEVAGLRIGDFRLVLFPGELTVQIGLNIKQRAPGPFTFVAGYSNGYIFYTPTAEQRRNPGYAQEDCDTLVAPEWQGLFEAKALAVLGRL
ncbi:MAG: hypothetical protein JNK87_23765 [Bryobacterales bacterium]|nr:hypothetical protein [Bryobacterales bacterium]